MSRFTRLRLVSETRNPSYEAPELRELWSLVSETGLTLVMRVTGLRDVSETRDCGYTEAKGPLSPPRAVGDDGLVLAPYGPDDLVRSGLREVVAARAALDRLEAVLVVEGRRRGYRWSVLGAELGLTGHGVRRRHLARDPIYAWKQSRPPSPAEELRAFLASLDGKMGE